MAENRAAYFRTAARDSLRGRWKTAVLAGVLASMLGGALDASNVNFEFGNQGSATVVEPEVALIATVSTVVYAIAFWALGSIVRLGYGKFNLDLVDREEVGVKTLFAYFRNWKNALAASFLQILFTLLWSLLLIVPGIIAGYSYAMTPYILAEDPTLSATEAIALSKSYMEGNRWRLFCLDFSFIGWTFLTILTLGIGMLWLLPYQHAARAAFYREVSGTAKIE